MTNFDQWKQTLNRLLHEAGDARYADDFDQAELRRAAEAGITPEQYRIKTNGIPAAEPDVSGASGLHSGEGPTVEELFPAQPWHGVKGKKRSRASSIVDAAYRTALGLAASARTPLETGRHIRAALDVLEAVLGTGEIVEGRSPDLPGRWATYYANERNKPDKFREYGNPSPRTLEELLRKCRRVHVGGGSDRENAQGELAKVQDQVRYDAGVCIAFWLDSYIYANATLCHYQWKQITSLIIMSMWNRESLDTCVGPHRWLAVPFAWGLGVTIGIIGLLFMVRLYL
ncbi:MAG: hypothetical protein NT029_06270 [Armatimonadetes bacterium]|nr:hypothetical protein [Armatimonadota bacterium]